MKGILSKDKRTIIGPVTMDEPECWNWKVTTDGPPCPVCKEYKQHLASLPSIPAVGFEGHEPGEVSYVEGWLVKTSSYQGESDHVFRDKKEGIKKYNEWSKYDGQLQSMTKEPVAVAIPSPQGDESNIERERNKVDANIYIDRAIKMLKDTFGENVAAYNGVVSLLRYAKESHMSFHTLTTEQLVALWEEACKYGAGNPKAKDFKAYLKQQLNIDIP